MGIMRLKGADIFLRAYIRALKKMAVANAK